MFVKIVLIAFSAALAFTLGCFLLTFYRDYSDDES